MKFKAVGLSVVLGLSLTGCSSGISTEDFRTCSDAKYAQELYLDEYMNTPESQRFWVQKSFAKELRDLTERDLNPDLSDALMDDANRIENSDKFLPIKERVNEICIGWFDNTY